MTVADTAKWHTWFAWRPVLDRWSDTKVTVIWLEEIERRRVRGPLASYWEYRPLSKS